ncbi:beta-ketoacyl synthase [Nemania sp. FL0916]|nr:beta-ketoacyl synthase [Nemania sp. FL0916]
MPGQLRLCIFGDQTFDLGPHWKSFFGLRSDPIVDDFLTKAYDAVRNEVYRMPLEEQESLPRFTCINDLILLNQKGKRCVAIDTAIGSIYQLAVFINQAESWYHGEGQPLVVGLCLGGLAAAAVSSSTTVAQLVDRAVDAVIAAFRIGYHGSETAKRLVPRGSDDEGQSNWSVLLGGPMAMESFTRFHERSVSPLTSSPYISAYSPGAVTVSGPPRVLSQLLNSKELSGLKARKLPVFAPFHASHLYTAADCDVILKGLGSSRGTEQSVSAAFLSSTGVMIQGHSFADVLRDATEAILVQPMRFPVLLDQIQKYVEDLGPESLDMTPIATTADRLISNTFKETSLSALFSQPASIRTSLPYDTPASNPKTAKLAIVGMSGRFPGGNSTDAFWEVLVQGLDMHKPVPPDRWDIDTHVDLSLKRKNTGSVPYGCWIDDAGDFDARFFNISPREAPQIDPAQRLAIMSVYEATERAGLIVNATPSTRSDRIGVFYGVTGNDWAETNSAQDIDTYLIPGGNRAFIPGRINYFFKFSGPSYAVDTACSSALSAIHVACNSIWRGDVDTAVAGGTNFITNPDFHAGLDRGHFLSRTGNCRTFDDTADGYCRGEGVGTVIIKRLDDAIADNDPILAVILDTYTNHSSESESITRPHAGAQCAAFERLLNYNLVDPFSISYIEMHGTGTQVGDATEMSSVLTTFAPSPSRVTRGRSQEQALFLGSAKANIGHGEASSGSSSLIKVLLMMQNNLIVPHCGIKTKINHKFPRDFEQRNVNIATKPVKWPRSSDSSKPRRALINNFSAAGGNTALLIEDSPPEPTFMDGDVDKRSTHIVAVSAKSGTSLQGNLKGLLNFLRLNMNVPLGRLSYTTTARRIHHKHRVMVSGSSIDEICNQIETAIRQSVGITRPKSSPRIIFAYTGQGAQFSGMGKEFFEHVPIFRREMHRLDSLVQKLGFSSMLPGIQGLEETDIDTYAPVTVQLANVCMQMALTKMWASWKLTPFAVIGHSLGEYAALNAAGVLSDADTIYLVGKRAELLQARCTRGTHAMLVVRASVSEISQVLGDKSDIVEVACINSPVETVLAGTSEALSEAAQILADSEKKTTLLKVPFAFHSSQIDPILAELQEIAQDLVFAKPTVPVLCPLDGTAIADEDVFGPQYLVRHSREPVNMIQALLKAREVNIIDDRAVIVEIGPHPALSGMVRSVLGPQVPSLPSSQRRRSMWQTLSSALKHLYMAGHNFHWSGYHNGHAASCRVLPLPTYSWDLKNYWIPYVHDWSLRKGDPPLRANSRELMIESTTIHRIVEEVELDSGIRIVVEADIARADLSRLVQGHEVDGIPLCTPSVYADIALSLGTYTRLNHPDIKDCLVDVGEMMISKPLMLKPVATQGQLLQAHMEASWPSKSAQIKFMSFGKNKQLQEHARCTLQFKDTSLRESLQKDLPEVNRKIQELRDGIMSGATARYNRAMCYRAIRPLAKFHPDYQAANEVLLDSKTLEVSSRVNFATVKRGGNFHTHPAMIDALTQSCGFAMNCNDDVDLDQNVYMNHGWGSLQIFEPLNYTDEYITYTRMREGANQLWSGDVVVSDHNSRVIAYFGQVAIQCVPRRILKVILSIESGTKSHGPQQNSQPSLTKAKSASVKEPLRHITPKKISHHELTTYPGSSPARAAAALTIIAEEGGLSVADLTDTTSFSDLGIDSLLGLTIAARLKEELNEDVDFNALLFELPTVGEFKRRFLGQDRNSDTSETSSLGRVTPLLDTSSSGATSVIVQEDEAFAISKAEKHTFDFTRALGIIAEESGISLNDLSDETVFADAGVDSLLSLVIVSRFRDELHLDIKQESLFLECPTVAELRKVLLGETLDAPTHSTETVEHIDTANNRDSHYTSAEAPGLKAREMAIDELVQRYTAGYASPIAPSAIAPAPRIDEKVVIVTGASGGLGSHLVHHLIQSPDVKKVVCLNRPNTEEPYKRQLKAMRSKGIQFPEEFEKKLLVFQTDTSVSHLGLSDETYGLLLGSATHLIHSAWPMSAKRTLSGFESQFQVMRNLIELGRDVVSRRPPSFKFSFQLVSSIGVVGLYGKKNDSQSTKTLVPEDRLGVECILNNGYGDAKWGCERMVDETLHKSPDRFRAAVVRLGQIAGSRTSGYWNPREHFGFLVKSSQTLGAWPDLPGEVHWTPVEDVAATLVDLAFSEEKTHKFYHIENPVGQPWSRVSAIFADALQIAKIIPFEEWVKRVRAAPQRDNPATALIEFFDDNYIRMSCGGVVLSTQHALEQSDSLRKVGPVGDDVVRMYVNAWKENGVLS